MITHRAGLAGLLLLVLVLPRAPIATAATDPAAALTVDILRELETGCPADAALRTAQETLNREDGASAAIDREQLNTIGADFSVRLPDEPVADQQKTGRCWLFSALNLFRRDAAQRLGVADFEFSQNHLYFYAKLEKANLFLAAIAETRTRPADDRRVEWLLRNPAPDWGNWRDFVELVRKYGAMPKAVMPETYSSAHSEDMNDVLTRRLHVAAVRIRAATSETEVAALHRQALQDVYRLLALHLGIPPRQFSWPAPDGAGSGATRTYTPQQFFRETTGANLDDYCAVYSIPTLPFGRRYEIDLDKSVHDRPNLDFVNLPLAVLKEAALACLRDGHAVWFGCAVSQETLPEDGLMAPGLHGLEAFYGIDLTLSRRELFETFTSTPEHNMIFTGVDLVDGRPVKWLVENSRGAKTGRNGYFIMTDTWLDLYVPMIVVPRKHLPPSVLPAFETPVETLPPWDPMS